MHVHMEHHQISELARQQQVSSWNRSPIIADADEYPVRIHTLGRFGIQHEQAVVNLSQGRKQRPFKMLQALIAFGGREVHADLLCQALWPDAEGDMAQNSFDVTLHRLRRTFGIKDLFKLSDRHLTLDSELAWVDAWEFERLINHCEKLLAQSYDLEAVREMIDCSEQLLNLYQGTFLECESTHGWTLRLRERLRSKLLRHILDAGRTCENHKCLDAAMRLYRKGLEIDPLIEELYLRLMSCYRDSGRIAEAIGTFNYCRILLSQHLLITPSEATMKLYASLRN
ncbi:MAG: BTAD domain-containing putative transcriptional regulator [Gammaproteobacteria bacterium]|nr:MAG: BTAD domain-containing putative transcriptional regulator [Gammaproteobacteria bacterium]